VQRFPRITQKVDAVGSCLPGTAHPFVACVVEDDMTERWDAVVLMGRSVSDPRGGPKHPRPARWPSWAAENRFVNRSL